MPDTGEAAESSSVVPAAHTSTDPAPHSKQKVNPEPQPDADKAVSWFSWYCWLMLHHLEFRRYGDCLLYCRPPSQPRSPNSLEMTELPVLPIIKKLQLSRPKRLLWIRPTISSYPATLPGLTTTVLTGLRREVCPSFLMKRINPKPPRCKYHKHLRMLYLANRLPRKTF